MHQALGFACAGFALGVAGCADASGTDALTEGQAAPIEVSCGDWPTEHVEFEEDVIVLVNEVRAVGATCGTETYGPTIAVTLNEALRCAARGHSVDMAARDFFDHVNPDGVDPGDRVVDAGYDFSITGENIAAGQPTPGRVVEAWLDSPGHCRNILEPRFSEIGVGYYFDANNRYGHLWTQNFGHPF